MEVVVPIEGSLTHLDLLGSTALVGGTVVMAIAGSVSPGGRRQYELVVASSVRYLLDGNDRPMSGQ